MISWQCYEDLKTEFGYNSSWAIWAVPKSGNWKSKDSVADMTPFQDEKELIQSLNGNYIFVGLNPAVHNHVPHSLMVWENFHSSDAKRSQDYKLRYALQGTQYWGSFITDIYTGIADTDSASAMKKVTGKATADSIGNLLRIREILGGKAVIVAMGTKAHAILKKNLPTGIELKVITHYSAYVNIDDYRKNVLQQLGTQVDAKTIIPSEKEDLKKLYNAFIDLCDFIETDENIGCGNCPLYETMCGNKTSNAAKEFSEALARIRKKAGIPDP